jgi:hypothetical protein
VFLSAEAQGGVLSLTLHQRLVTICELFIFLSVLIFLVAMAANSENSRCSARVKVTSF